MSGLRAEDVKEALELNWLAEMGEPPNMVTAGGVVAAAAREWLASQEQTRDVVDPYVAETLYEEHIARNIEARGGMAATSDWPAWEELPDIGRDYWMGLAVAARLASKAALVGLASQEQTPDYEAALESLRTMFYPNEYSDGYALEAVKQAVDAALVGFHSQPEEER